jgi:hypothetical protein
MWHLQYNLFKSKNVVRNYFFPVHLQHIALGVDHGVPDDVTSAVAVERRAAQQVDAALE